MTDENQTTESVDKVEETKKDSNEITVAKDAYQAIIDENERLKAHHEKIAQEKRDEVARVKAEADKAAKEKAEKEGDLKTVLKLQQKEADEKIAALEKQLSNWQEKEKLSKVETVAQELANKLCKSHTGKNADLKDKLMKNLKLTEDGVKSIGADGNINSNNFDELLSNMRKDYDYLCDGNQSQGSAGVVNTSNAEKSKAGITLTPTQKLVQARTQT